MCLNIDYQNTVGKCCVQKNILINLLFTLESSSNVWADNTWAYEGKHGSSINI